MSIQKNRNVKVISLSLQPEILDKLEADRGDISRSKFLSNKIINNGNVNTEVINTELRTITSKMMLLQDILKKMVPAMVREKVSVNFSEQEFEEVKKYA